MNFDRDDNLENDLFAQRMIEFIDNQHTPDQYRPVPVNDNILRYMRFEEVLIVDMTHLNASFPKRYFKNMVPDVAIHKCEHCNKFFVLDEYEFAYMEQGHCPFCKNVEKDKETKAVFGSLADMRM